MSFVLDDGTLRQVEDSSESITDSVCNGSVVGRPVPHLGVTFEFGNLWTSRY